MQIFRGQVTNNNSPLKDGKVQVRIPGIHPDNSGFEVVEDQDLPWLEMMSGGNLHNEIGFSQVPIIGQWVHVLVPDNLDEMIVIGQVRSSVTDVNKYQKGEGFKTLQSYEHSDFQTITEPVELDSKTVYPFSSSFFSESGHLVMSDDTEGNERLKIQHRTGQFFEFRPDGTYELRTPQDGFLIVEGDLKTQIEGTVNHYVNKQVTVELQDRLDVLIKKQVDIEVQKTLDLLIKEETKIDILKSLDLFVDDNTSQHITGLGNVTVDMPLTVTVGAQILTLNPDGSANLSLQGGANTLNVTGNIIASGEITTLINNVNLSSHMHTGNLGQPTPIIPGT